MVPQRQFTLSVRSNRALGFVLVGVSVMIIFGSVGTLYVTGQHYGALYSFNKVFATLSEEDTIDTIQTRVAEVYDRSQSDVFARQIAQYRLAQVNTLLGLQEPTSEQQQTFQAAIVDGVNAAQLATEIDPTEPRNWQVLGQIYSVLVAANVDGAFDRANDAYNRAAEQMPNNPTIPLLKAELALRSGDEAGAREYAERSIALKRNFTDALLFLSQLDILEDDVEAAIERTESIISIEPENPARYYQLGILHSAAGNETESLLAFERAVDLNEEYANARFFLALGYANADRTEDALKQLRVVSKLNPNNGEVQTMMERLENGQPLTNPEEAVSEEVGDAVLEDGSTVNSSTMSETSLVAPVNAIPDDENTETNNAEDENSTPEEE